MTEPDPTKLPQAELELTEDELERIFLGSEESVIDKDVPSDISDEDFKVDHIEKNIEKKTINLKPVIEKSNKPKKLERKNKLEKKKIEKQEVEKTDEPEPDKRPQGRPLKWTKEKIEQKKEENRQLAKLGRLQRQEHLRIAQLSGDHPVSEYEKNKRINEVIKTKDEIEKHITEKRTILKGALERKHVSILDRGSKCKNHLYKISHLDVVTKDPIATCQHCSGMKQFSSSEWKLYLTKHKGEL